MRSLHSLPLLFVLLVACGARSALKEPAATADVVVPPLDVAADISVVPDIPRVRDVPVARDIPEVRDVPVTVRALCPASQRAVETQTATLMGGGSHSLGLALTYQWTIELAPSGTPSPMSALTSPASASSGLRLVSAGTWRARLTVTDASGRGDSCVTTIEADPAIDLVCPADQSRYQSDIAVLTGRALSRLGRTLSYQWTVMRRPPGSTSTPTPATGVLETRLACDQLGDFTVRLTATDGGGLSRSCAANVHVDPDVVAVCPPDQVSVPFSAVNLAGAGASRLGRPLTYQWAREVAPSTSTASLVNATSPTARFTFDVAGDFVWRLTVANDRGNRASCTARAFSRSDEAIRVETVWNVDSSCRSCNPRGGGIDIDLHLTDLSRSLGRWAGGAPDNSDCYFANCRCDRGVGMLCPDGVLMWQPAGAVNNPQLDVDHISDLPGPENINVTRAQPGSRFAVGIHYYSGEEPTPVIVRVYCGGVVVFESERVTISGAMDPESNPMWKVGEITVGGDGRACVFARCGRAGALTECIRPQNAW